MSPNDRRMWAIFQALDDGWSVEQLHAATRIDRWFLTQFSELAELRRAAGVVDWREMSPDLLKALKRTGFGDDELGAIAGVDAQSVTARRHEQKLRPVFKRIDTCAAEFESFTPYMYGTYETECEARPDRSADGRHPRQRTEPGSDKGSSSTTAAVTRRSRCVTKGTRPS